MIKITDTHEKILSIDIGGSRIKAILLDVEGKMLIEYQRLDTPHPATPERVMETIAKLTDGFAGYTRLSQQHYPQILRSFHTTPAVGSWQKAFLHDRNPGHTMVCL